MKVHVVISFIVALLLVFVPGMSSATKANKVGAVYVMTNSPVENRVVVFERDAQGMLTPAGSYITGGKGSGGGINPLGSQGALIRSKDNDWLMAVNAGSNDFSLFSINRPDLKRPPELILEDQINSGGAFPSSIAFRRPFLYVLNSDPGGAPNITGFRLRGSGTLIPLTDSSRSLGAGDFSQIGFSNTRSFFVATERSRSEIYVFKSASGGDRLLSQTPVISSSPGIAPFGFVFDRRNHLIVTEAGSGAVSSFTVMRSRDLEVITPSLGNDQSATCWIAANRKGFAYTTNTASNTISAYKINSKGSLSLLEKVAGYGNAPIDLAISANDLFAYVLNAADGTVGMFKIERDGSLTEIGSPVGHPYLSFPYAQGIAAQ